MSRRIAEGSLSLCVVLLMFGTSSMAQVSGPYDSSATPADVMPGDSWEYDGRAPCSNCRTDHPSGGPAYGEGSGYGADPDLGGGPAYGGRPGYGGGAGYGAGPEYGREPGYGGGPGERSSFPHFPLPSRSYSVFRSPTSYGWGARERCAPSAFTPRGNGIPIRTSCYRMDYRPYELTHDSSKHGPAYYQRHNLCPCVDCNGKLRRPQCYNATQY